VRETLVDAVRTLPRRWLESYAVTVEPQSQLAGEPGQRISLLRNRFRAHGIVSFFGLRLYFDSAPVFEAVLTRFPGVQTERSCTELGNEQSTAEHGYIFHEQNHLDLHHHGILHQPELVHH
jgi:hypothetical protein